MAEKHTHTPGPWVTKKAAHGPIDIFDSRDRDVVTVYGGGVPESKEANARLIAQAPAMLEVLIKLRGACMGFVPECAAEVDAVIAAATGEAP